MLQIRGMHTLIRDREISKHDFVFYSDRLIRLVILFLALLFIYTIVQLLCSYTLMRTLGCGAWPWPFAIHRETSNNSTRCAHHVFPHPLLIACIYVCLCRNHRIWSFIHVWPLTDSDSIYFISCLLSWDVVSTFISACYTCLCVLHKEYSACPWILSFLVFQDQCILGLISARNYVGFQLFEGEL